MSINKVMATGNLTRDRSCARRPPARRCCAGMAVNDRARNQTGEVGPPELRGASSSAHAPGDDRILAKSMKVAVEAAAPAHGRTRATAAAAEECRRIDLMSSRAARQPPRAPPRPDAATRRSAPQDARSPRGQPRRRPGDVNDEDIPF
ncbi:MAG: hypothetical protein ACLTZW_03605 [Paratractidigestivibacter faecalis]